MSNKKISIDFLEKNIQRFLMRAFGPGPEVPIFLKKLGLATDENLTREERIKRLNYLKNDLESKALDIIAAKPRSESEIEEDVSRAGKRAGRALELFESIADESVRNSRENSFQAKDIQKALEIKKHRYSYLADKIPIKPEVEEVDGTGNTNRYSFKNLLQFAFAHEANNLGFSPATVRDMLKFFDKFSSDSSMDIYGLETPYDLSLSYVNFENMLYFRLHGDLDEKDALHAYDLCKCKTLDLIEEEVMARLKEEGIDESDEDEVIAFLEKRIEGNEELSKALNNFRHLITFTNHRDLKEELRYSTWYITININVIKSKMLEYCWSGI